MQPEIPANILDIVERCSSDANSVTWTEAELFAQFLIEFGLPHLGEKIKQVKQGVDAGKYNVVADDEDVVELMLILGERVIPFPYRKGVSLDEVVPKLLKKHNLANGAEKGSEEYNEVYKRVRSVIHSTTKHYELEGRRPVYSENHLRRRGPARPQTPEVASPESVSIPHRPSTPEVDDDKSVRDIMDFMKTTRKHKSHSRHSTSNSSPNRRSQASKPQSPPRTTSPPSSTKQKFVLKPPKRVSPAKGRSSIGSIRSLSAVEEKKVHEPTPTRPVPSASRMTNSRVPSKKTRHVRGRDIVKMVMDKGERNTMRHLFGLGLSDREWEVVSDRLPCWKKFVATELLSGGDSRSHSRRSSSRRQIGKKTPRYFLDDSDDDDDRDGFLIDENFDEYDYIDETRTEIDEELDSYLVRGTSVWARTPNQMFFRKGRVTSTTEESQICIRFEDGREPNNRYFVVEHCSSRVRRSQPPLEQIHIDSDDFKFSYLDDPTAEEREHAKTQKDLVATMTKIANICAGMDQPRRSDAVNEPNDRPRRKQKTWSSQASDKIPGRGHSLKKPEASFSFGSFSHNSNGLDFGLNDVDEEVDDFVLDDDAEKIAVRIRLKSGKRIDAEFNITHTVGDVRKFLNCSHPIFGDYKLIMLGFPRKELVDNSQNVMDAQLKNSQIQQS